MTTAPDTNLEATLLDQKPSHEYIGAAEITGFYREWVSVFRLYVSDRLYMKYASLLKGKLRSALWGEVVENIWGNYNTLPTPNDLLAAQDHVTWIKEHQDGEADR